MSREELLKKIEEQARRDNVPVMLEDGLSFLVSFIEEHPKIHRILELGTAVGWSASHMASIREDIIIDTIEIDPETAKKATANIAELGLSDRIHVYCMDAMDFETEEDYDLIFVDAAKSQYRNYLEHFFGNTHRGTFYLFDNLAFHGIVDNESLSHNRSTIQMVHKIKRFRNWLSVEPRFDTVYYADRGDGIAVARRIR